MNKKPKKPNNLKTTLCNKLIQEGKVQDGDVIRHSYSTNRLENGDKNMGRTENQEGLSPTLDTRCDCLGVVESAYTELEKQLFTKGGHVKRYIGSEKIDRFEEGQMATTTFPNGYGHGPRTHNESIALNTIDRPSVKVKEYMKEEKLCPKELLFYIMGLCGIIDNIKGEKNEKRIREILPILWQEIGKKEIQKEIRRFWCVQEKKILQPRMYEQSIFESWFNQANIQCGSQYFTNNSTEDFKLSKCLFSLWESWKNRYTPHRWELSQQQFEQFNAFMSQLPHHDTPQEKSVHDLWETSKGFGVLQQALYEIQEIWESTLPQEQSERRLRIRKLVPLETLKLMGFTREDYLAMREIGMSDSAIYHCAGDSIITTCLMAIFGQLLPISEEELNNNIKEYVERVKE